MTATTNSKRVYKFLHPNQVFKDSYYIQPFYQSQLSAKKAASCSRYFLSSSSKPEGSVQSMSMIATTYYSLVRFSTQASWIVHTSPFTRIGTTISLRLSASHAMCPGNSSTSGTTTVSRLAAAAPQTPFPKRISWHAGLPWKGPSRRSWSSDDVYVVEMVTPPVPGAPGSGGEEMGEARVGNLSSRM